MHKSSLMYYDRVASDELASNPTPLDFVQLLADPIRWRLLDELGRSDRRVGELCEIVGESQSLVSYHLRELRSGDLVRARRSAFDGRDTYYRRDFGRFVDLWTLAGAALHPGIHGVSTEPVSPTRHRRRRQQVLFLCTGNSSRSQMAEALLGHRSNGAILARSGGSHPKPLHRLAVRVMADRGIDISQNRSKHFSEFASDRFDRVVTLCDKVREVCPEFPGHPDAVHWSMADPADRSGGQGRQRDFVRTADELEDRIGPLIAQLSSDVPTERKRL